jgi:hypothetical protein
LAGFRIAQFIGLEQALTARLKTQIQYNRDSIESADVAGRIHGVAVFKTRGPQWRRRRVVVFG